MCLIKEEGLEYQTEAPDALPPIRPDEDLYRWIHILDVYLNSPFPDDEGLRMLSTQIVKSLPEK